ncbi:MAG: hypothetical protein IPK44_06630 [Candidatus Accumulibacter sp.]|jgi:hypothetical protein|uniref:RipA family octameric membrane protein n=1 Tax=Accumulibacter sp. TaxID=2053492 RepID=UPI001AC7106F|nr:hypothetical protein [Accumulibacter sp.]MBK8114228.1 hypothetical protein [Accumulibacter sp.]MBN8436908.1 hypothetical protein [Accumulibacter sp.]
MNQQEYEKKFAGTIPDGEHTLKAEKALDLALDIRKFEIELYWKRATYFWTFIGAALAGYALVYKTSVGDDSWLLLVFSNLGFLFSIAWYLVNRGSKFWQNNWERHVDLLEDLVIGPLYKTIAEGVGSKNPLTSPGQYSVSKINQILSVFISLFWVLLIFKSLWPISSSLEPNWFKVGVLVVTVSAVSCLLYFGKSSNKETKTKLTPRSFCVEP